MSIDSNASRRYVQSGETPGVAAPWSTQAGNHGNLAGAKEPAAGVDLMNVGKTITGWWCNNHLEKYDFVSGKDDIPCMKWKKSKTTTRYFIGPRMDTFFCVKCMFRFWNGC